MRGAAVSAAGAASPGARRAAAGARGLALPGEKLLHRGQVSRACPFEKFLLLPHLKSQRIRRRRGEKEKTGALDCLSEIPLRPPPPLFFLSPPLQVISHYCRSFGEETKASPADGSVYPDPRCRWRKSLVGGTVPASSKLPLTSPPSSVRHFLETALFFCTYKSSPAPPPKLLYKKVDGYKQYGAPAQKLALFMPITHWNKLEICSTRQFSQYDHLIA